MSLFSKIMFSAAVALVIPSLAPAAFDEKAPILCAIRDVSECAAAYPCVEVTPEEVALPDFFRIDLAGKQVLSAGMAEKTVSPIRQVERMKGNLILQGGDPGGDNPRGGVGWTMTVNEEDGGLTIAGVADGFAMVVFGSCMQ